MNGPGAASTAPALAEPEWRSDVPKRTPEERFWSRVDKHPDGCWLWTGAISTNGYGSFGVVGTTSRRAHRVAYEWLVGPIPDGLELDHLCRVRRCVRPDHLEPVTHQENLRRSVPYLALPTHCPQGHVYDEANTYRPPKRPTHRECRTCNRDRKRERDARRRVERDQ